VVNNSPPATGNLPSLQIMLAANLHLFIFLLISPLLLSVEAAIPRLADADAADAAAFTLFFAELAALASFCLQVNVGLVSLIIIYTNKIKNIMKIRDFQIKIETNLTNAIKNII
jgi:hypothetical protein